MTAAAIQAPSRVVGSGHDLPPDYVVLGRASSENFPVASRLLPAALRSDLMSLYGWARLVDQLGDDYPGDRLGALDEVEDQLQAALGARQTRLWKRDPPPRGADGRDSPAVGVAHGAAVRPRPGQPARPDRFQVRNLCRSRRLLPPVGQPGRADRARHVRLCHARPAGLVGQHLYRAAAGRALAGRGRRRHWSVGSTCRWTT